MRLWSNLSKGTFLIWHCSEVEEDNSNDFPGPRTFSRTGDKHREVLRGCREHLGRVNSFPKDKAGYLRWKKLGSIMSFHPGQTGADHWTTPPFPSSLPHLPSLHIEELLSGVCLFFKNAHSYFLFPTVARTVWMFQILGVAEMGHVYTAVLFGS